VKEIVGTVTISLADYQDMVLAGERADELNSKTKHAAKELSVFLTFLATRSDVTPYVTEFNRQSMSAKIVLDDGRATIEFLDGNS
tara:strand:+ start:1030 stop:1284 length:255 start_codon:yes stop_codon:yes gene_type:complete